MNRFCVSPPPALLPRTTFTRSRAKRSSGAARRVMSGGMVWRFLWCFLATTAFLPRFPLPLFPPFSFEKAVSLMSFTCTISVPVHVNNVGSEGFHTKSLILTPSIQMIFSHPFLSPTHVHDSRCVCRQLSTFYPRGLEPGA